MVSLTLHVHHSIRRLVLTNSSTFATIDRVTPVERSKLMMKLAELIEANADELSALETLDNGKAYSVSHFDRGL